jgi:hypothetical protein
MLPSAPPSPLRRQSRQLSAADYGLQDAYHLSVFINSHGLLERELPGRPVRWPRLTKRRRACRTLETPLFSKGGQSQRGTISLNRVSTVTSQIAIGFENYAGNHDLLLVLPLLAGLEVTCCDAVIELPPAAEYSTVLG